MAARATRISGDLAGGMELTFIAAPMIRNLFLTSAVADAHHLYRCSQGEALFTQLPISDSPAQPLQYPRPSFVYNGGWVRR
jgi:hypothetical protein